MAGRIRDEDVALVKERADLAQVVGDRLTLRSAGGGSLKGLCPFHDEKTPSFNVRPDRGVWHCFGCGEGGDVISFVRKVDHLDFTEAVERLADRFGVRLRYDDDGPASGAPVRRTGVRTRLTQAHAAAAEFYQAQLATLPDAVAGRRFLAERGFTQDDARHFGVGYSPRTWDALVQHLRSKGFRDEEIVEGGLGRRRNDGSGVIDRFVGRLMWPIRDRSGDVVGFGARRLHDDDRIEAKYLNTSETPVFKKSQVLYGVDLAKRSIPQRMQAVVVEGYTDVMACHLAGVTTAVATCGTAFGDEHVKILRQLLMDQDELRGEVVFTFDGDAAGQKAALKAFDTDQRFVTQTFVAVEPSGMDPCELRQHAGDEAVRELVARRVPLFEFALRSTVGRYDLGTAEGRVSALRAAAPVLGRIRDRSLRPEYVRTVAGWLGLEVEAVAGAVRRAAGEGGREEVAGARRAPARPEVPARAGGPARPDPGDPVLFVEREALKLALQAPRLAGEGYDLLEASCFTAPAYAAVHAAVVGAGGCAGAQEGPAWPARVSDAAADDGVRALATELAVEAPRDRAWSARYAAELVARLEEMAATRRLVEVKARLQRVNPVEEPEAYNRLAGELFALEGHRRRLRERGIGAGEHADR
ncbi:DNA primase [Vallicoccus soli]|uniref:DNA primase n=1 Tax=Vallicoccus soli TaxID=2339232 RepID=A0A3A3Z2T7_9ACTN|nr:DNA primase [Vallicoccus soli]RJK97019.1 DNA primase [Vallicoccus soli]